jgi:hypothetical protein
MKKHPLCLSKGSVDLLFHGAVRASLPGSSRAAFFNYYFVASFSRNTSFTVGAPQPIGLIDLFEYNQFIIRFLIHVT